jgi:hypothetical protein
LGRSGTSSLVCVLVVSSLLVGRLGIDGLLLHVLLPLHPGSWHT